MANGLRPSHTLFFFFKQKTAYEMVYSDWSSDVCSSDLLRAMPNLWMVRPGDANETVAAWQIALERDGGPVGFALSRQKLPVLGGEGVADTREGPLRGGYVLWQRDPGAEPDAIVLATGSEVAIALEGARSLDLNARVVSLPCWELFEEQPDE